jgi:phage FluMu protein Com
MMSNPLRPYLSMLHVQCTKCNAINTVQPGKAHLQQICGQCHKLLPPVNPNRAAGPGPMMPPVPQTQAQTTANDAELALALQRQQQQMMMRTGHMQQPQPAPAGGGAGGPQILQGEVQSVQARCGQCGAINALPIQSRQPGAQISFKCGQCGAINKVTL